VQTIDNSHSQDPGATLAPASAAPLITPQGGSTRGADSASASGSVVETRLGLLAGVRLAFDIAFFPRYAYPLSLVGAVAMLALLTWSGGFVTYYASTGWDFYASTQEIATMLILAALFGVLLPLQVAAIVKARSAAGTAGGVFGTLFGVLSMSCCAPLILPALLSFIGFSGMTLLQVNIAVHEWATPLTIASIGFMLLAIGLVSRTITAVCAVPPRRT
jgi:hypothetical protein